MAFSGADHGFSSSQDLGQSEVGQAAFALRNKQPLPDGNLIDSSKIRDLLYGSDAPKETVVPSDVAQSHAFLLTIMRKYPGLRQSGDLQERARQIADRTHPGSAEQVLQRASVYCSAIEPLDSDWHIGYAILNFDESAAEATHPKSISGKIQTNGLILETFSGQVEDVDESGNGQVRLQNSGERQSLAKLPAADMKRLNLRYGDSFAGEIVSTSRGAELRITAVPATPLSHAQRAEIKAKIRKAFPPRDVSPEG